MALPKSEEKRIALLEAALSMIASQGLSAATSAIAKSAGVAEGTLFRYFATKDVLFNELYLYIKLNLGESMRSRLPQNQSLDILVKALWDGYIDWGVNNLDAIKTLKQLSVSDKITKETHVKVTALLPEIQQISSACIAQGGLAAQPMAFANAIFMAIADTTMQFIVREPEHSEVYKTAGFKVLWEGLTH